MKCPKCHSDNLPNTMYCSKCATPLKVSDEISLAISGKMKLKLLGEEKGRTVKRYTEDLEAYDLYLKGLYFRRKITEDGIKKAIEYFNLAIDKDPGFALLCPRRE